MGITPSSIRDTLTAGIGIAGALSTWSSLAAHLGQLLRTSRAQFLRSLCATTLCGYTALAVGLSV